MVLNTSIYIYIYIYIYMHFFLIGFLLKQIGVLKKINNFVWCFIKINNFLIYQYYLLLLLLPYWGHVVIYSTGNITSFLEWYVISTLKIYFYLCTLDVINHFTIKKCNFVIQVAKIYFYVSKSWVPNSRNKLTSQDVRDIVFSLDFAV